MIFGSVISNPLILLKWRKMFYRYYWNWHHGLFDYTNGREKAGGPGKRTFRLWFRLTHALTVLLIPGIWLLALLLYPLTGGLNALMKAVLPVLEPVYTGLLRLCASWAERRSRKRVGHVVRCDPSLFEVRP
jgi:hypothetical protein